MKVLTCSIAHRSSVVPPLYISAMSPDCLLLFYISIVATVTIRERWWI